MLHESLQEDWARTAEDDLWVVVGIVNTKHHCTNLIVLAEIICRNLLATWKSKLIAFLIHKHDLTLPYLIYLGCCNASDEILVFVIELIFLQLENLCSKSLTEIKDCTTTELFKVDLLREILSNLNVCNCLASLTQRYLHILILELIVSNNGAVLPDLEISLVRVDNDIIVLVSLKHLCQHTAERILKYADHC